MTLRLMAPGTGGGECGGALGVALTYCESLENVAYSFFSPFIFISWRLITLQYCSGFCHTLT